mgnify:CR=1 FL=1
MLLIDIIKFIIGIFILIISFVFLKLFGVLFLVTLVLLYFFVFFFDKLS